MRINKDSLVFSLMLSYLDFPNQLFYLEENTSKHL